MPGTPVRPHSHNIHRHFQATHSVHPPHAGAYLQYLDRPAQQPARNQVQVGGLFWNYFSIGMDAKAAYGFHSLREKRPWAASGRAVNQAWYGYFSCSSGWFCAAPALRNKARLQVGPTKLLRSQQYK